MYGITSMLKSLMPASLLMRLTSQRKSAHISLRTRRVSFSTGGGLRVTRTTFRDAPLENFTVDLDHPSNGFPFRAHPGQKLPPPILVAADPFPAAASPLEEHNLALVALPSAAAYASADIEKFSSDLARSKNIYLFPSHNENRRWVGPICESAAPAHIHKTTQGARVRGGVIFCTSPKICAHSPPHKSRPRIVYTPLWAFPRCEILYREERYMSGAKRKKEPPNTRPARALKQVNPYPFPLFPRGGPKRGDNCGLP